MADERSNASKNNLLSVRQQIVAPIQCRLKGPVSANGRPMAQSQQFQPRHQAGNRVLDAECGHLTRRQLDCQRYAIQLSAHFRDKRCLLVGENEASRSRRHALYKQLRCRISKHGVYRLRRAVWWTIKGKNPVTMFTLYFQQFSTRGQNMDLFRLPVELLGKRGDRLDHMLAAIEND